MADDVCWMADRVLDAVIAGNDYNEGLGNLSRDSLIMINSLEPVCESGGLTFQLHSSLQTWAWMFLIPFRLKCNSDFTQASACTDTRPPAQASAIYPQMFMWDSKTRLRYLQNRPVADNLLTEGPIFRDNLSALINDSYLLQFFFKVSEPMAPPGSPWDGRRPRPSASRGEMLMACAQCPDRCPATSNWRDQHHVQYNPHTVS